MPKHYTYWPKGKEGSEVTRMQRIAMSNRWSCPEHVWLYKKLCHRKPKWNYFSIFGFCILDAWCATKSCAIIMDLPRTLQQRTIEQECRSRHLFFVKPFDDAALQQILNQIDKLPQTVNGRSVDPYRN